MDIHAYVRDLQTRAARHKGQYRQIIDLADGELSYSWLCKFASREINNPKVGALVALDRALARLRLQILRQLDAA